MSVSFPTVTRTSAAIVAMIGVLAMSMPGGACFLWAGLGVDHHHHQDVEQEAAVESCFHDHECSDHGELPEQPCDPDEESSLVASLSVFKLDPHALPPVTDFSPDWVKAPDAALGGDFAMILRAPVQARAGASQPAVAVRLCRFLI